MNLGAGYATAHSNDVIDEHPSLQEPETLQKAAILVHAEQLKEWLLTDLPELDATHG